MACSEKLGNVVAGDVVVFTYTFARTASGVREGISITMAVVALKHPPDSVFFFQSRLSIAKRCCRPIVILSGMYMPSVSTRCYIDVDVAVRWRYKVS